MCAKVAKKAPKKKANALYKLPEPIPAGEVLCDLKKKQWIVGKSIGVGGFGAIYSAAPYSGNIPKDYPNAVKIEPHENGPLFVEMHFYMKNAKPEEIDAWKKKKKMSELGMPRYIASGSHEFNNTKYRFLIMDRYGTDVWKLFEENNKKFPEYTVYKIALQIINVLEYIHHKSYVHGDIKGANLLLGLKNLYQVYLVDFGLACRCTTKSEYKLDPSKAHDGTIEYTSRDAHMGIPTMRGDFEILGYNMIQWLGGSLPWEKNLKSPLTVQKQKEKAFENISDFLDQYYTNLIPKPLYKYMMLLATLKFNETPNYEKFMKILTNGLKEIGHTPSGKLEFKQVSNLPKQQVNAKVTPQKVKKNTAPSRKSPRNQNRLKSPSPVRNNSIFDDSNVAIVINKKRGRLQDIQQALRNVKSDEEYDITIVKKTKLKNDSSNVKVTKTRKGKISNRTKQNTSVTSDSEFEEVIPTQKNKRQITSPNVKRSTRNKQLRKQVIYDNTSDEDMFD